MNATIASMIRLSGRSWWQARYYDGKVLSEWDTVTTKLHLPGKNNYTSRWEEVPKDHMIGLRILCPEPQQDPPYVRNSELEAREGHRFFQFKQSIMSIGTGGGGSGRATVAHVIGVVKDTEGNCLCSAWEEADRMTCPEFEALEKKLMHLPNSDDRAKVLATLDAYRAQGFGKYTWRLIQFEDNIHNMRYRNVGPLGLDVQQVAA